MCLADGTPIAIISTRAKDGTWVRTGWLNLSTGGFTAGAPPASATPCNPNDNGGGDEPATLAGVHVEDWCDVDDDGNVLSPVLAKYTVDDAGAITGVEFLTPDGEPYEIQGTLGICNTDGPADLTGRELVRLCDVADDGTITVFVRDYERDDTGAVVSYSDYDLDGQPYTPVGEIGACEEALDVPTREHDLVRLCDSIESGEDVETVEFIRDYERDPNGQIVGHSDYTLDGQPYEPQGEVGQCQPANSGADPLPEFDVAPIVLCDTVDGGEGEQTVEFLRFFRVDNSTGEVSGHTDTELDGITPYEPVGDVGQCQSGGECCEPPEPVPSLDIRCETFVLCDTGNPDVGDEPVSFMRAVCRDSTGNVVSVTDTELDAVTPYTVRA